MNRSTVLLGLLFVTPAVGRAQEPPDSVAQEWERFVLQLPFEPAAAARAINNTYARRGLPLTYWVKDSLPDAALSNLATHFHPCGVVAFVHARQIPPADRRLQAERIVEIDSSGRELRRWAVPVDTWPVALRDNELVVNMTVGFRGNLGLAIRLDGSYRVVPEQITSPQTVDCPKYTAFGDSAYMRCARVSNRLLVYEGPCT